MTVKQFLSRGIYILTIPLIGLAYAPINHASEKVYSLVTVLDDKIPFESFFIIPYLTWYIVIIAGLLWLLFKDNKLYISSISTMVIGMLISFVVYSVFQTTVPRPEVLGQDIFSRLTRMVYHMDNPYNAFPSIHVITSYAIFKASNRLKRESRKTSIFFRILSMSVIISTLFVKQHTLMDVFAGIVIGDILFYMAGKVYTFVIRMKEKREFGPKSVRGSISKVDNY